MTTITYDDSAPDTEHLSAERTIEELISDDDTLRFFRGYINAIGLTIILGICVGIIVYVIGRVL